MTLTLTGHDLKLNDVVGVARERERVRLSRDAIDEMRATREIVDRALSSGAPVYGLTTGVGALKDVRLDPRTADDLQRLILERHAVGQGPFAQEEVIRAAMVCAANHLASGYPGVRPIVAERFVDALNGALTPSVHSIGSVGESDLTAMAELSLQVVDIELLPGEALALLNAGSLSTGWGAVALFDAMRLVEVLEVGAAMSLEAFAATPTPLDPAAERARGYPGLARSARRLRGLLIDSEIWQPSFPRHLQDPLSFRCASQVLGAARDALGFMRGQIAIELNASQGNPLVVRERNEIVSVGQFSNLPLAQALDLARIGLAPALTQAVERTLKMLEATWSGLPGGLGEAERGDPGLSIVGVTAVALAAEARSLAQPVSFEVVSTSLADGIEDEITMASLGARRLAGIVELGQRIAATELLTAATASSLRGVESGRWTAAARSHVAGLDGSVSERLDLLAEHAAAGLLSFSDAGE